MQMFLMNLAQSIMGFKSLIAADSSSGITNATGFFNRVMKPVVDILDGMLVPILILVGTAGSIYAIVLGVNFSKAESADKREEAKKRMINAIIGLVVTIVLLILFKLLFISFNYCNCVSFYFVRNALLRLLTVIFFFNSSIISYTFFLLSSNYFYNLFHR